ncbi:MAG: acyltransferase family protein [Porphyromonadaceae bacterium]|jgi:membrane protein|nr:acyltransferase family protein [Porphyromonadaceae bacterium]
MSSLSTERQPATARASVSSLYVLKALLAFVVVTCHSPLVLPWVHIPGFVVELFFAITGYFLYTADLGKVQLRIWKSVKKIIPIIFILQVFYNLIVPPEFGPITSSYWLYIQWIFMGFSTFDSGHLWYLTALLLGLLFLGGYLRIMKGRRVPLLFLLILPWIFIGPYRMLLFDKPESIFVFNFLTRAVPFLAMGYWVRANEENLLKYRWINIFFLVLTLMGIECLVTWCLSGYKYAASAIALFPMPFAAFMLMLSYKSLGQGTWLETIGEKYSGNIYYFHMAVIIGWKALNAHSPLLSEIYEYGGAFIVFFISLGIAWLVVKLQDLIGYHVLK